MHSRRRFLQGGAAALAVSSLPACGGSGHRKEPATGVPRSPFNANSTAEEVTRGLDLSGQLVVVTGCTSGIGLETMRVLAMRGAHVVGTSRSLERAQDACNKVIGSTSPVVLDLGDPESVVACAESILSLGAPIDRLICNAGYRGGGNDLELINGVEKHFAINHLGHFLLVNRLLERLHQAQQGRIVVVASRFAYQHAAPEGIQFDNLAWQGDYDDKTAYAHSKLANVLFAYKLGRVLVGTPVTANALHPGLINTEIDRNLSKIVQLGWGLFTMIEGKSIPEGAATTCFVATAPSLANVTGEYFEDCNAVSVTGEHHLTNMPMADRLWLASEELLSDHLVHYQRRDTPDETTTGDDRS